MCPENRDLDVILEASPASTRGRCESGRIWIATRPHGSGFTVFLHVNSPRWLPSTPRYALPLKVRELATTFSYDPQLSRARGGGSCGIKGGLTNRSDRRLAIPECRRWESSRAISLSLPDARWTLRLHGTFDALKAINTMKARRRNHGRDPQDAVLYRTPLSKA